MKPEVDLLIDEIHQIVEQYKAEVPAGNRSWPKSIEDRVIKLFPIMNPLRIAELTGISRSTIYYWHRSVRGVLKPRRPKIIREGGAFLPLKISSTVENFSTVETKATSAQSTTLFGPNGIVIKDVTPAFAAQLFKLLRETDGDQI